MDVSKLFIATLLLSLLVLQFTAIEAGTGSAKINCDMSCKVRCGASSRPNLCKRACGTCCARCNCVPSGTSGNYDECACYGSLTTRGGKHKCP